MIQNTIDQATISTNTLITPKHINRQQKYSDDLITQLQTESSCVQEE